MKYLTLFFAACLITALVYFGLALGLAPAPIASEYWVRELIIVKRSVAKHTEGHPRLLVAAGSNVLFGIDTEKMTRELGIPVLNLGLHGSLPLDTILNETELSARTGDTVILPLEYTYYTQDELSSWQARSAIAWNHEQWYRWNLWERVMAIRSCNALLMPEILCARLLEKLAPGSLQRRLETLDDERVLRAFAGRKPTEGFAYSINNLDDLGNLRETAVSKYFGVPWPADQDLDFCQANLAKLEAFIRRLTQKNIPVYFAHPPYVRTERLNTAKLEISDRRTIQRLRRIAPVIDKAEDLLFDRSEFLDTDLHLNDTGRAKRTDLLIHAILSTEDMRIPKP